jgi:low affinity Fe/Cu permease
MPLRDSGSDRHPVRVFAVLANKASQTAGRATPFVLACAPIVIWAVNKTIVPIFGYLAACNQHWHHHRDFS